MNFTGERAVPWNAKTGAQLMYHHVMRYAWALQYCAGKRVVDLGCGCGYGTFMLGWVADFALGLDVSADAVLFAQHHYPSGNVSYQVCDIEQETFPGADLYVAFEVLEHLAEPVALLERLHAPVIWSVPMFDDSKFHRQIYNETRARRQLGASEMFYQMPDGLIVLDATYGIAKYQIGYRNVL